MAESEVAQIDPRSLMRVLDVTRELSAPLSLDELLSRVIDAGRDVLQAERGTVFLYDESSRELYATVATGAKEIRFSIDTGLAGECARNRAIINVPDCYADPRFNKDIDRKTGYRTRCLITLPLVGLEDQLVGVMQLLNSAKNCFDANDEKLAEVLGSQAAVAIQRARLVEERLIKLKLESDLQVARTIQMSTLPTELPQIEGYQIAGRSEPAEETGGDIYDLVLQDSDANGDDRLIMLLADATGHGIGPALSVTQVRSMLRLGVRLKAPLDELLEHVNRQLAEDLTGGRFVTAFLGELDPKTHELSYHAAGQGPVLIYRAATGECEYADATAIPLGILPDLPSAERVEATLEPGDIAVLLTDGFYEEVDHRKEPVGRERIASVVAAHRDATADQLLEALFSFVDAFVGGRPKDDDLTAIIVRRTS